MELLKYLFSHVVLWSLIAAASVFVLFMILGALGYLAQILFVIFYPLYGITLKPVIWGIITLFQTRCPKCKRFFKKKNVNFEIADEHVSRRTVNRVDQGVLHSNEIFALDYGFEISRQEQVTFVERTFIRTWQCKDPACGNQWQTEEYTEEEGSLDQ